MKTHILPLLGRLILPVVVLAGLAGPAPAQPVPCSQVPNFENFGDTNYDGCIGTGELPFPEASDHIGLTFDPPIDILGEEYTLGWETGVSDLGMAAQILFGSAEYAEMMVTAKSLIIITRSDTRVVDRKIADLLKDFEPILIIRTRRPM